MQRIWPAWRQRQRGDGSVSTRAPSGQSRASSVDTVQSGDAMSESMSETIASAVVEEVPQEARGPVYNMYGREVARPYACRDDVGAFGILTGNWGGHRANKETQAAMNVDLKTGPATIICLQEAHQGVDDVLTKKPEYILPTRGDTRRPQAQYYTLRAKENCNTNCIAVRVNVASELTSVRFQRTRDGFYNLKDGRRYTARSRIQVAQVTWRKPNGRDDNHGCGELPHAPHGGEEATWVPRWVQELLRHAGGKHPPIERPLRGWGLEYVIVGRR